MGEMRESIRAIVDFAAAMPRLRDMVAGHFAGEVIEYECDAGWCIGFYMYRRDGADGWAASRTCMGEGAQLKRHSHDEIEIATVIHGRLSYVLEETDPPVEVGPTETITIPPGQAHTVIGIESSERVSITIPASRWYPRHDRE